MLPADSICQIYLEFCGMTVQIIEKKSFSKTISTLRHTKTELSRLKYFNHRMLDSLVSNYDSATYFSDIAAKVFSFIADNDLEIAAIYCTPNNKMLMNLADMKNQGNSFFSVLGNFAASSMVGLEYELIQYQLEKHGDTMMLTSLTKDDYSEVITRKQISFLKNNGIWLFSDIETNREQISTDGRRN